MIDLIEKLKRPVTHVSFDEGYNKAIDDVIQLFNQYNIITVPKSIKLSEIVDRLKEEYKDYEFRYDINNISIWKKRWCYAVFGILNNKLKLKPDTDFEIPKWLYALWLANTEIIDDLKEGESNGN